MAASRTISLALAAAVSLCAGTFTSLHSFNGGDGANPYSALAQGADGNFYGATEHGGAQGLGTVFRIAPDGTFTSLYSFCSLANCADGSFPTSTLTRTPNGDFYGTTALGGFSNGGTFFRITPAGALTTLHKFCSQPNCSDGVSPYSSVVLVDGDFYGTTLQGGATGSGTIYRMTPSGTLTTLYSFCTQGNCLDGALPSSALVHAAGGAFFGATSAGGANGRGTIFKLTPAGALTTLHNFCADSTCPDGNDPQGALIQAASGDLYGTTVFGGASGHGTVFKITPGGNFTTLYSFCSQDGCPDGVFPSAALLQAPDGSFYGTTAGSQSLGPIYGTAFSITAAGSLTTLHSFDGLDGQAPDAALVPGPGGNLYGTTSIGGENSQGTIFRLLMPN